MSSAQYMIFVSCDYKLQCPHNYRQQVVILPSVKAVTRDQLTVTSLENFSRTTTDGITATPGTTTVRANINEIMQLQNSNNKQRQSNSSYCVIYTKNTTTHNKINNSSKTMRRKLL